MKSFLLLILSLMTGGEATADCKDPFNQTAYRTAQTSITCDEGNKEDSRFKFFCKENGPICEDILSTKSALRSNGTFTLTETESGFTLSISNVSTQHAGVYWCGEESTEGSYRAALRKIQLEVKAAIKNFTRSPTIGQNMTYWCQYPEGAPVKKFICKGEDPSKCEHVVSTAQNTERFSMSDETEKRNLTITVRGVTKEDSGTYWCGAEHIDFLQGQYFYHRFLMTVVLFIFSVTGSLYNLTSIVPHTASYSFLSRFRSGLCVGDGFGSLFGCDAAYARSIFGLHGMGTSYENKQRSMKTKRTARWRLLVWRGIKKKIPSCSQEKTTGGG
ncbi:hypothetical protein KUCAC02_032600, partial [Chaenocephalus aceratus]